MEHDEWRIVAVLKTLSILTEKGKCHMTKTTVTDFALSIWIFTGSFD